MTTNKDQLFIAYCMKQGYISMDKVREFLDLSLKNKSIVSLIARELGWNKEKTLEEIRLSQEQKKPGHDKNTVEQDLPEISHKTKIGKYILVSKLGAGGMGSVYKAYHSELQTYFAIKTISSGEIDNGQVERFKREAKISSQFRHPNIVRVYDVGVENNQHYIVMEYIDGKDLSKILKEEKILFRKALKIILKISQALQYAHETMVIHRDIKPGNIIIADDEEGTPYLMDFGLASTVQASTKLTRTGQVLGTPQYMSPEQALGENRIDGRSDIYSLGAVLYEMLTRHPVVKGEGNLAMICNRIVNQDPVPPSKLNSNISKDLESITIKCLEKEPARRYQSAGDLAKDIERYLEGEAVTASSSGYLYRIWRKIRRNWKFFTIVAVLFLIAVGTVIWEIASAPAEKLKIQVLSLEEQAKDLEYKGNLKGAGNIYISIINLNRGNTQALDCLRLIKKKMEKEAIRRESEENLIGARKSYEEILELDIGCREAKDGIRRIRNKIEEQWTKANEFERTKYFDKALELCRKLITWDPNDERFAKYILELTQSKEACRREARKYYDRAMEVFWNPKLNEKEVEKCKGLFEKAIEIDPTFAEAHFQAGRASHRLFNTKDALDHYKKSQKHDPTLTPPKYYLTALELPFIIEKNRGIPDNQILAKFDERFNEIWTGNKVIVPHIPLETNDPYPLLAKTQFLLTKLHVLRKDETNQYQNTWKECMKYCEKVIEEAPTFSDAYFMRAQLYSYLVDIREGASHDIHINSDPVDLEQALKDCGQGIYLDPFRMEFYSLRGMIYQTIGAYDLAEKDYTKVLLLKNIPQIVFYQNRALCYAAMRKFDLTLEELNQVLKLAQLQSQSPDIMDAFIWRAITKACLKDKKGAEEDLNSFINIASEISSMINFKEMYESIVYIFIDDNLDRAQKACRVFLSKNHNQVKQLQLLVIAITGREASISFIQNITLLLKNIRNLFCAQPELKNILPELKRFNDTISNVSLLLGGVGTDAKLEYAFRSLIIQICLDIWNKDPMIKERQNIINMLFQKEYSPLTSDFFLYCFSYLDERSYTKILLNLRYLPSASLYYRRAVEHYIQRNYENARQDLDSALELNPNYMEAHYGLSTIYSILSEKDTSYRDIAIYHLKRAVENGWDHLLDYTMKDPDFRALGLGNKVPLEELHSWDRKRLENERRITEFSDNVNVLVSDGKLIEALKILYEPKPELFPKLNDLIDSIEKKVMENLLKDTAKESESDIDRRVEQLLGERGKIMWDWAKRGR